MTVKRLILQAFEIMIKGFEVVSPQTNCVSYCVNYDHKMAYYTGPVAHKIKLPNVVTAIVT